ncbi:hypothetical protein B0H14DRAFT_2556051 [Mycena olivaceomarginata]|nr:hypothetical protein B0H14DRAFT_2556051 [Mycena olivaceomarginata]
MWCFCGERASSFSGTRHLKSPGSEIPLFSCSDRFLGSAILIFGILDIENPQGLYTNVYHATKIWVYTNLRRCWGAIISLPDRRGLEAGSAEKTRSENVLSVEVGWILESKSAQGGTSLAIESDDARLGTEFIGAICGFDTVNPNARLQVNRTYRDSLNPEDFLPTRGRRPSRRRAVSMTLAVNRVNAGQLQKCGVQT